MLPTRSPACFLPQARHTAYRSPPCMRVRWSCATGPRRRHAGRRLVHRHVPAVGRPGGGRAGQYPHPSGSVFAGGALPPPGAAAAPESSCTHGCCSTTFGASCNLHCALTLLRWCFVCRILPTILTTIPPLPPQFAAALTRAGAVDKLLPVLHACAGDASWRVRYMMSDVIVDVRRASAGSLRVVVLVAKGGCPDIALRHIMLYYVQHAIHNPEHTRLAATRSKRHFVATHLTAQCDTTQRSTI